MKLEDKKRKNRTKIKKEKTCYGNTCELFIALFGFFFLLMHNIYTQQTVRDLHKLYFMTVSLIYFIHLLLFYISIPSILRLTLSYLMCVIFLRACFSPKFIRSTAITAVGLSFYGTTLLNKNLLLHTTKLTSENFHSLKTKLSNVSISLYIFFFGIGSCFMFTAEFLTA